MASSRPQDEQASERISYGVPIRPVLLKVRSSFDILSYAVISTLPEPQLAFETVKTPSGMYSYRPDARRSPK